MEQKETRFDYVYENLKRRIMDGTLQKGNRIPSARKLSDEFQISIFTIKKVIAALKEEGLIAIEPRYAPVVIYQSDNSSEQYEEAAILSQQDLILSVYQTMALTLPSILTFASQDCPIESLPHYKQKTKFSKTYNESAAWRSLTLLIKEILNFTNNPLFSDLFASFNIYARLPYFVERNPYFAERFLNQKVPITTRSIESLRGKDSIKKYHWLERTYTELYACIEDSLRQLRTDYPDAPPSSDVQFVWQPNRGRNYSYMRIVQDLTHRIAKAAIPVGTILHEGSLAEEYGVSVSTVRSALAVMSQRGFIEILNGKGSKVILPDEANISQAPLLSPTKTNILQYLHATQLMVLISGPAAYYAAQNGLQEELTLLSREAEKPGIALINSLFLCIYKHIDLKPLQTVFTSTSQLTQYGYYLVFYSVKEGTAQYLDRMSHKVLEHLQNGNIQEFADGFADCYRWILTKVRQYMLEKYHFEEAASVKIPPQLRI